ncbi:flavodoxin family protein [Clostridium baratii]|uniref:flavodoxin family protein n=1 Tax=Clostridium baratii TaxID=1561 RepID=UPI003D332667
MKKNSKILFINGSPNPSGNTAKLANTLLHEKDYEVMNLTDYKIYSYGQNFDDDQFAEVLSKIKEASVLVIGSPMYWHNICGSVRNLLDRFYGPVESGSLVGRKLYFLFQGAAPEKWMLEAGEYTMRRFAALYGMEYCGMAINNQEAEKLSKSI